MNTKLLFAGLTLVACAGLSQAQDLALNGSFETINGDPAYAADWIQFGNVFREEAFPYDGSANLTSYGAFNGGFSVGGFYQDFPCGQGSTVTAKIWTQVLSADPLLGQNFAAFNIEWHDAFGNMISYVTSTVANPSTTTDTWIQNTMAGVAPSGCVTARVVGLFFQYADTDTGSLKWDLATVEIEEACLSDVNQDGVSDLNDFFDFFNSFDAGCD